MKELAPAQIVIRIASAPGELAWLDTGYDVSSVPRRFVDAGVYAMPPDDGAATRPTWLGSQAYTNAAGIDVAVGGLAADARYVYWTALDAGTVSRAPWGGGAAEALVGLVVDSSAVYWSTFGSADAGGAIMKLAKWRAARSASAGRLWGAA